MRALRPGRRDVPAVVARREAGSAHLLALRVALRAARRASPRARASAGSAPASRRSAGRANRWKVTIADTGLPGRPKTSLPSRAPNQVGFPGFSAHAPEALLDAELRASAGFTWSCGPTETPPETHTTSASVERRVERRLGRGAVVGHDGRA